jgi:hypothetical protein
MCVRYPPDVDIIQEHCHLFPVTIWLVSFVSKRSPVLLGKNAYFARYPMLGTVPGKKCRKSAWRMELKIKFTL